VRARVRVPRVCRGAGRVPQVPAGGRRVHQCVSELKSPTLMRPFFSVVS